MILSNANVTYKSRNFEYVKRTMMKEAQDVISFVETNIDKFRAQGDRRVVTACAWSDLGISTRAEVKANEAQPGPGLQGVNSLLLDQDDGGLDRRITFERTDQGLEIFERYDWEGDYIKVTRDPKSGSLFIED